MAHKVYCIVFDVPLGGSDKHKVFWLCLHATTPHHSGLHLVAEMWYWVSKMNILSHNFILHS